ncbi:MAG: molybdopterin-guanine dinucleotide biosynthesis protein B [Spirochaetota bacterium]
MTNIVISIVGRSGTGKTTLLEKLVNELVKRGWRVGTIKHDVHGFTIDHEGKDSWRHKKAGAAITVISSPFSVAVMKDTDHDAEIDELVTKYFEDVDIVLTEGYKRSKKPKIEVFRKEAYNDLLCTDDDNLIAVATDTQLDVNVPQFNINDAREIVDFIEKQYLANRNRELIMLEVDGKPISMKPFLQTMLINAISGMIRSLDGCEEHKKIVVRIETGQDEKKVGRTNNLNKELSVT